MSHNNFVIQDIVEHVYHEQDYRSRRVFTHAIREMAQKLWVFIIIIGLSAGIGYVAVYLPESVRSSAGSGDSGTGMIMKGMPAELQNLSDEQKRELFEKYGGR